MPVASITEPISGGSQAVYKEGFVAVGLEREPPLEARSELNEYRRSSSPSSTWMSTAPRMASVRSSSSLKSALEGQETANLRARTSSPQNGRAITRLERLGLPARTATQLNIKGEPVPAPSFYLNRLAALQTALQENIQEYVDTEPEKRVPGLLPIFYAEHLIGGWRVDVRVVEGPTSVPVTRWQSLHWRLGTYAFGESGSGKLPAPVLAEGFTTPAAASEPVAEGEPIAELSIREVIARWDGWSLAAPRPGNQINQDGSVTAPNGNPAISHRDINEYMNAQLSAEFTIPPAGREAKDLVTNAYIGTTGLPRSASDAPISTGCAPSTSAAGRCHRPPKCPTGHSSWSRRIGVGSPCARHFCSRSPH